ncbi:hypothetical protein TNIN_330631 [Trichonephila inaurata madagascariensis]|uniref:Uncharacterized protein n=1 Tax=Trichonephila inaurata madagascariensis TaxID=2747483 RepID=A0A8X7CGY9_9ARAC|nr:hypothetical protein TNIN_330631 [Trichonephila inaurata madagascariensis]
MRGLKDGAVARKPVPTFPDVRGQVEDIILGNRGRKTSLWSSHTARNRSDFNIRHLSNCFNGRSVTGLTPFLCPVKGLSVCLNVPRTSSTASEALVCRLKHQGRAKVLENDHLTIRRG